MPETSSIFPKPNVYYAPRPIVQPGIVVDGTSHHQILGGRGSEKPAGGPCLGCGGFVEGHQMCEGILDRLY